MARDSIPAFPRTRHLALAERGGAADAADALLVPLEDLERSSEAPAASGAAETPPGALAQAAPGTALAAGAPAAAAQEGAPPPPQPPAPPLPRVAVVDVFTPTSDAERCASLEGTPLDVRCPCSLEGRQRSGEAAARAARFAEAVLLDGLDRWYQLGSEGAGFCSSCAATLVEFLRESYGEHLEPFEALEQIRISAGPLRERPFARQREALRFAETVEAGKRAVLRARDEARRARAMEIAVLARTGPIGPASLALCRHLDGLVFELPTPDPAEALLPLLAARAALGQRPAVALLPSSVTPAQVRQLAALATSCDADLALPRDASPEAWQALTAHRRFLAEVRERYRPADPLVDAEILLSPTCDHWSAGAHARAASACVAALARAQLQPAIRLDLSGGSHARLLVVAHASALPPADANAVRRHVETGGDLLLVGRCATVDEEGRVGDPVFPNLKEGLDRVGEGRAYVLSEAALLASSPGKDDSPIARAIRELAGRGRSQVTVAGRGRLFLRAYLDPERKLDVHLVNLDLRDDAVVPAQGMQVTIAGQAAGGSRSGYWFAPDRAGGKDGERIALSPSGFSVSTILPGVGPYALLTVPR